MLPVKGCWGFVQGVSSCGKRVLSQIKDLCSQIDSGLSVH